MAKTPSTPASPGVVQLDTVRQAYEMAASRSKKPALPFEEMLSLSDYAERLDANSKYTSRIMATKEDSTTGHLFVNGKHVPMSGVSIAMTLLRFSRLTTAMDGFRSARAQQPTSVPRRTGEGGICDVADTRSRTAASRKICREHFTICPRPLKGAANTSCPVSPRTS